MYSYSSLAAIAMANTAIYLGSCTSSSSRSSSVSTAKVDLALELIFQTDGPAYEISTKKYCQYL